MLSTEKSAELMYRIIRINKICKEGVVEEANQLYDKFMLDLDALAPLCPRYELVNYIYSLDVTSV
ncbi:hypothetical protein FCMLKIFP_00036 [Pseudomonas phage Ka3]|nr:hypothetical protein FCMLKIFP_00036 [Pseudomonas phage Ka3]